MRLVVNGDPRDFPEGLTVGALLESMEVRGDRVAIELNRDIVPRAQWPHTTLKDGDRLEIVHFVGGGVPGGASR